VVDGIVDPQAHGLAHLVLAQVQADAREDLDLRLAPERLGVDQQSIEVEDDRRDRQLPAGGRGGDVGGQSSFRTTSTMASPASVGFFATMTPAADSASIFVCAVPLDPEMMAPACPILRPGGAVTPAT